LALEADFLELIEFRILIETECARLAAGRLKDPARKDLEKILQKMTKATGNRDEFGELDIAFHLRIARASKNRMYATLLAALEARCIDYAQTNRGTAVWYGGVVQAHQQILTALIDADADRAAAAMRNHLVSSRQHFIALASAPE
jgi:GntR family transcriptional repressor for pyruvate dehydrogenase complex